MLGRRRSQDANQFTPTADVAIVGNGSLALSLARALSDLRDDIRIAVVGPPGRQGAASTTAAAMLNCWAEISTGALEDPISRLRFDLARSAIDVWDEWASGLEAETGIVCDVRWGTCVINSSQGYPAEDTSFAYLMQAMKANDALAEVPTPADPFPLEPTPKRRPLRTQMVPDGHVDSLKVMAALDRSAQVRGVHRIDGMVRLIRADAESGGTVVLQDDREIAASFIVIANGAYARELSFADCDLATTILPLFYGGGSALELRLPTWREPTPRLAGLEHVIRTLDRGGACGLHLVPLGDNRFYVGASSGVWDEPETDHRLHALAFLAEAADRDFEHTLFHTGVTLRGPGHRPVSLDGLPLLGETSARGIWYLNGMKRDGFTCAPYLARETARAIIGERHALPVEFLPERTPISFRSREFAIEAAVDAALGGEMMHGLELPPYALAPWLDSTRARVESIYERRNLGDFGIHPELLHFYEYDSSYERDIARFFSA